VTETASWDQLRPLHPDLAPNNTKSTMCYEHVYDFVWIRGSMPTIHRPVLEVIQAYNANAASVPRSANPGSDVKSSNIPLLVEQPS
jgi:hypothetical protein